MNTVLASLAVLICACPVVQLWWLATETSVGELVHGASGPCQPPFQNVSGLCLHLNTAAAVSWCEAARLCQDIGGELPMDPQVIRAVKNQPGSTSAMWVGITDTLVERYTSRSGWLMTNGTLFPTLGTSDWHVDMPNSADSSDDMVAVGPSGLGDYRNFFSWGFACQPVATPSSGTFKRASFLQLGDITPYYCYTEILSVQRQMLCVQRCASRWQCRAALYKQDEATCRMLDYADASVGDAIEKSGQWVKFVKVYA